MSTLLNRQVNESPMSPHLMRRMKSTYARAMESVSAAGPVRRKVAKNVR
jgi:hypothetical protein